MIEGKGRMYVLSVINKEEMIRHTRVCVLDCHGAKTWESALRRATISKHCVPNLNFKSTCPLPPNDLPGRPDDSIPVSIRFPSDSDFIQLSQAARFGCFKQRDPYQAAARPPAIPRSFIEIVSSHWQKKV